MIKLLYNLNISIKDEFRAKSVIQKQNGGINQESPQEDQN